MNAVIYYFSGTGNSFIVAKDISSELNAELNPIAAEIHSTIINIPATVVGVIFPEPETEMADY